MKIYDLTIAAIGSDGNKKGRVKMENYCQWAHGLLWEALPELRRQCPQSTQAVCSMLERMTWIYDMTAIFFQKACYLKSEQIYIKAQQYINFFQTKIFDIVLSYI